jgi:hypothetical protein
VDHAPHRASAASIEYGRRPSSAVRSRPAKLPHFSYVVDSFPDSRTLTDQQLVDFINVLTNEEHASDYLRSVAHGKIRVLRAELDRRSGEVGDGLS